jgi:hypothetical protein
LPEGWTLLRRLLPYWRECLRAEERPSTVLPLERANIEFCGLSAAVSWWPTAHRHTTLTLPSDKLPASLMNHLAQRRDQDVFFLGYPLQLLPGKGDLGAFARPVFTFVCQVDMQAGLLQVHAPAQGADVNADWLEKQFRDRATRRELLRWLGLAGPRSEDDGGDGDWEPTPDPDLDLPSLTERLSAWVDEKRTGAFTPGTLDTFLPPAQSTGSDHRKLLMLLETFCQRVRASGLERPFCSENGPLVRRLAKPAAAG